jgi:mono/diheme cytochrome c family protein
MRTGWKCALTVAAALVVAAVTSGLFIVSGIYDIGADDHHTAVVSLALGTLRDRSIAVRAASLEAQVPDDAGRIAAGARSYAALCAGCHLSPGRSRSDLSRGLYPHPPNLSQQAPPEARRAFWVIKHGIKMSAMPAWGSTLADPAIWDTVAFVRALPLMSQADYERLTR